ncbi:hypothetical protein TNCT_323531 [Trichonephila clavata]|uniref:Uncharacterized protein n=1 Tax=Trichonephila clavata TaxID=2740835 RepID=A0A8X6KUC4_TRICU|nr:hypothetical protein TNCT_323531 [Trichonephila clavata]
MYHDYCVLAGWIISSVISLPFWLLSLSSICSRNCIFYTLSGTAYTCCLTCIAFLCINDQVGNAVIQIFHILCCSFCGVFVIYTSRDKIV